MDEVQLCPKCHGEGTFEKYAGESVYGLRGDTVSIYHKYFCACRAGRLLERDNCKRLVERLKIEAAKVQKELDDARGMLKRALHRRGRQPVFIKKL